MREEFIRMGCSVKVSHKPAHWRSLVLAARCLCIRLIMQWIIYKCNLNVASCYYVCHPNGKELVSGGSSYKNRYVTLGALHSDCGSRTCWFGRTCWADRCTVIPRDPPTWLYDENAIHIPGEVHIEWHMHGRDKILLLFLWWWSSNITAGLEWNLYPALVLRPYLKPFWFNAPFQFTPLLNLRCLILSLTPFGGLLFIKLTSYFWRE